MVYNMCGHMCICKGCYSHMKGTNKCQMCNTNNTQAFLATEGGADDDDDE